MSPKKKRKRSGLAFTILTNIGSVLMLLFFLFFYYHLVLLRIISQTPAQPLGPFELFLFIFIVGGMLLYPISYWAYKTNAAQNLFRGGKHYFLAQRMRNTPPSKIHAAAVGLVEVFGRAQKANSLLKTPISGEKCVYWKIIAEYSHKGRMSDWRGFYREEKASQFHLKDETGRILVEPKTADLDIDAAHSYAGQIKVGKLDKRVIDYLSKKDVGLDSFGKTPIRVFEYCIKEGDEIYVLGSALPKEGAASEIGCENLIVKREPYEDTLLVTDSTEKMAERYFGADSKWEIKHGLKYFVLLCLILMWFFSLLLYSEISDLSVFYADIWMTVLLVISLVWFAFLGWTDPEAEKDRIIMEYFGMRRDKFEARYVKK